MAFAFLAIGATEPAAGAAVRCRDGEVWRAAAADDHVCVTPDTHRRTLAENAGSPVAVAAANALIRALPAKSWAVSSGSGRPSAPAETMSI